MFAFGLFVGMWIALLKILERMERNEDIVTIYLCPAMENVDFADPACFVINYMLTSATSTSS